MQPLGSLLMTQGHYHDLFFKKGHYYVIILQCLKMFDILLLVKSIKIVAVETEQILQQGLGLVHKNNLVGL